AVLTDADLVAITLNIATAVRDEPHATPALVVLAGGITAAYPLLIPLLADAMPDHEVVGTAAPEAKSAAAWGLRHLYTRSSVPLTTA
ncbi:MAG: hypothetical protein JWM40_124, partial [Frankiales bacterium]|nr:hypothetical protein [Frankiales bacterium]